MKHNIFLMLVQLIFAIRSVSPVSKPFSVSPMGPYKLIFKKIYNCNPTKTNAISHNMYVSIKNNHTWFFGNSTLEIPFDDTFFLEIKIAFKDSLGNWKENVLSHKMPKACSSLKKLMGISWNAFMNGAGSQNTECPIPPGLYVSPGFDPTIFEKSNIPKIFFYGTYKFHNYYTRKNEIFGCQALIIEFKRP